MTRDEKAISGIIRRYLSGSEITSDNALDALAAAIEYGRSTATAQTTARPVMTTAEPGKKFPITEAYTAAMELDTALVVAVYHYDEEVASHPREIALSVMLAGIMTKALDIQRALGNLARAEK